MKLNIQVFTINRSKVLINVAAKGFKRKRYLYYVRAGFLLLAIII